MTENDRLKWIISQMILVDNCWTVTLCLPVHKDGVREALDEIIEARNKSAQ